MSMTYRREDLLDWMTRRMISYLEAKYGSIVDDVKISSMVNVDTFQLDVVVMMQPYFKKEYTITPIMIMGCDKNEYEELISSICEDVVRDMNRYLVDKVGFEDTGSICLLEGNRENRG